MERRQDRQQNLASGADPAPAAPWRPAIAAVIGVLLGILLLYRETALSMAGIWARSETFTHGFLVPPIALWLVWRLRHRLAPLAPRPNVRYAAASLILGLAWLLGEMAAVAPVSQFALVGMIVCAVPALLGRQIAGRIAFPLGFLFFAVPFGEFAMPQLMEWTAGVTVWGLRLSGIPVYREGLHFVIPSGSWSVVEACSGVRYLIASLMVGTLFAYLSYRSLKRRWIFIGVSLLVPIIANWMRAYLIVMLGHLSGNKLAAGVDHLIYGWVFFGLVIMIMFWIGARWSEPENDPAPQPAQRTAGSGTARSAIGIVPVAALTLACAALWPLAEWRMDSRRAPEVTRLAALAPLDGWRATDTPLTEWRPHFFQPSAELHGTFVRDGKTVGLYVGFYRNQDKTRKLVTSINDLVSSEDRSWIRVASGKRDIEVAGQTLAVKTAELRGGAGDAKRLVAWHWYWIGGRLTASDYRAKIYTALHRLAGQGDDSAVVIVYAPKDSPGGADAVLAGFLATAGGPIVEALRRSGDDR